jgi:hypothetical protein
MGEPVGSRGRSVADRCLPSLGMVWRTFQEDWCLHVHKGERDKLRDAACALLHRLTIYSLNPTTASPTSCQTKKRPT